jgi:thiol:disulfide interchange protein DsbD
METLKQVMGFPMMAAVVWMASVLLALSGPGALVFLLGAFVASGLGAWAWGRWGGMDRPRAVRIAAAVVALSLVLASAVLAVRTSVTTRPAAAEADSSTAAVAGEAWEAWTPARVEELRSEGRPVFIDFSARWCLTCQVNERVALASPQVRRAFRDRGVALLKADWTDRSEVIAAALAGYGRAGVPLYVLYAPGASRPVLLPEVLTPGIVLAALENLPAR